MMGNKEKYRIFCKLEKDIPIFSKDWWLDSVCGENYWDVVLVEKEGEIVASMPYFYIRKYRFDLLVSPPLTQNLGPYLKYPDNQKISKKLSYEKKIMNQQPDLHCDDEMLINPSNWNQL